jgi:phosphatidylethanolamine/phosphatidyl-N-methylethanolamine N-methyltransferase
MQKVQHFYDVFSSVYDSFMSRVEGKEFLEWQALLWSKVEGRNILEVGVGTGRSFSFYPRYARVKGIDFSPKMLARARAKALKNHIEVQLDLMDIQKLASEENSFDTVVSSLVFCSVPDPLEGLLELRRVLRPFGKLVMLEHVISDNFAAAVSMKVLNLPVAGLTGENITRRTQETVRSAGFVLERVTRLSSLFRLIEARK